MGNCFTVVSTPAKGKTLVLDKRQEEFSSSATVDGTPSGSYECPKLLHHAKPYTPLPSNSELQKGEVYYVVPAPLPSVQPERLVSFRTAKKRALNRRRRRRRRVKVVVTKEQLDLILDSARHVKAQGVIVQLIRRYQLAEDCRKWRPSLSAIPEVDNF